MKVDSRIQPLSCQTAILDTGTSHIRIPADDFDLIKALLADYSQSTCSVSEQGNLECDCGLRGQPSNFPVIKFNFSSSKGKIDYELTPDDYVTKLGLTCYMKFNRLNKRVDSNQNGGEETIKGQYWVLGATFLKKYYAVFDLDQNFIALSRSNYVNPMNGAFISWPQFKYFTLRACMFACFAYICYELLIVRIL